MDRFMDIIQVFGNTTGYVFGIHWMDIKGIYKETKDIFFGYLSEI
jgi:hypothetical protein